MSELRPAPGTRQPKQATRAMILRRAYEMYLEGRLEQGNEKLQRVLDDLGYTTGAAYQIWSSQEAFRADLRVHVVENIEYAHLSKIADKLEDLARQDLTFEQFVLAGADAYYAMFLGRPEFYLTLRFFAMDETRQPEITEALVDSYTRASWNETELFDATLARYDRKLRDMVEMVDVTVAATALVEGYALRARIEPGRASQRVEFGGQDHFMFSVAFLAMINGFIQPR